MVVRTAGSSEDDGVDEQGGPERDGDRLELPPDQVPGHRSQLRSAVAGCRVTWSCWIRTAGPGGPRSHEWSIASGRVGYFSIHQSSVFQLAVAVDGLPTMLCILGLIR